jgi:Type IV secretion system pilin
MHTYIRNTLYALSLAPMLAFGAAADLSYISNIVASVDGIITAMIPVAVALGILFFIWGLVQFILASGDESAKDEGKRRMIWGVVALFVIVSVWGLVALLGQLTGVGQTNGFTAVQVQGD